MLVSDASGVRERRRVVPQGMPRGGVDRPDAFLRRDAAGNYVRIICAVNT